MRIRSRNVSNFKVELNLSDLVKPKIDIIIPCFNPMKGWESVIVRSYNDLTKLLVHYELNFILVNDGSSENLKDSFELLATKVGNFSYIEGKENKGKGFAIREGMKISNSKHCFFTDVDFPYEESNLISMLKKLEDGCDIVIGRRQGKYYEKVPILRKYISLIFKKVVKIFFQLNTTDTQAGLKGFSAKGREVLLSTETNRYLFDLELVKRASKKKLKFGFVNVNLKEDIVLSQLSISILIKEFGNLLKILRV